MSTFIKDGESEHSESNPKLFAGERSLIIVSLIGFVLALCIAIFLLFNDPIILPEGNVKDAFSFNAAIGLFLLSIAAILPFAKLNTRSRRRIRVTFIIAVLFAYAVETTQHFRGINPRFTKEGTILDSIIGLLFGIDSIILTILPIILMIQFFKKKVFDNHSLFIVGIRYAFLSVLLALVAGGWMIALQGRYTGDSGNLLVLHGLGFHSLQSLVLLGWFLEKAQISKKHSRFFIHTGCVSWMIAIILVGFQTVLGLSVFKITTVPVFICITLFIWLLTLIVVFSFYVKRIKTNHLHSLDRTYVEKGD